jgi:Lipase maturation factor
MERAFGWVVGESAGSSYLVARWVFLRCLGVVYLVAFVALDDQVTGSSRWALDFHFWTQPFQPRLDWQMWFAALGRYEDTPWVASFLTRLLEGSPPVLQLLGESPFPDHAPRYVRAVLYDYRFTTAAERATTGAWWTRRLLGPYSPVLSLEG